MAVCRCQGPIVLKLHGVLGLDTSDDIDRLLISLLVKQGDREDAHGRWRKAGIEAQGEADFGLGIFGAADGIEDPGLRSMVVGVAWRNGHRLVDRRECLVVAALKLELPGLRRVGDSTRFFERKRKMLFVRLVSMHPSRP